MLAKVSDQKKSEVLKTSASVAMEAGKIAIDTENVVAYIEGSEKPDEYIVISSHLDHIGMTRDGEINNGADDDGSGSVAMRELHKPLNWLQKTDQHLSALVFFM